MDKKKNLLIGGLLAIVLVMAVGYAAFATNLNITSTAETTSTWDIEITNIQADKTATCTDSSDTSTCSTVGDISHSITDNNLTANFSTALISPGDSVVYTITVQNKGTLDATLSTITRTNSNNAAISFEIAGIAEGDSLAANQSKQFTATVTYVNQGAGQGQPASTSASFGVTLNYTQYAGSPAPSYTTVYAYHTDTKTVGTSTITDGVSDYTQLASYQNGTPYFLKYEIDGDNVIQNAYACHTFGVQGLEPICLQGGDSSYYGYDENGDHTGNVGILSDLNDNPAFTGSCSLGSDNSSCGVGGFSLRANAYGGVFARDGLSYAACNANNGYAWCNE